MMPLCQFAFTHVGVIAVLNAVCITAGYLMSFWNRPFFPEWCSDATLDNSVTYDTMIRIAGTWLGIARSFKAIALHHGWTHIVLLSDDEKNTVCWYGIQPFEEVFGQDDNYTLSWIRMGSNPTRKQLDDILHQIRSRTRGMRIIYKKLSYRRETARQLPTWRGLSPPVHSPSPSG